MVLKGNKKISLTEREYDTAKNILKDFPNKDLEKQVKESETENQKNQLEAKLNDLKKSVSDSQKQLDGKNKQISDLQKQLDDINKGNDKDKGKHAEDKQKEIDNANKDKNKISDTLKDQQGKEKEAQKALLVVIIYQALTTSLWHTLGFQELYKQVQQFKYGGLIVTAGYILLNILALVWLVKKLVKTWRY